MLCAPGGVDMNFGGNAIAHRSMHNRIPAEKSLVRWSKCEVRP